MDSNRTAIELFRLWSQQSQSQESSNQNDYSNLGNNSNQSNTTIHNNPSAQQSLNPLPIAYANTFPTANNLASDPPSNNTMTASTSAPRNISNMAPASLSYGGAPHPGALLFNASRRAQLQLQQHQMRARSAVAVDRVLGERELFLIFIKILFKCIERCSNGRLRQRAKAIVTECTRRNRMGDSEFSPLQDAVEARLKDIVGDTYWNQAKVYTGYYCQQKGIRTAVGV
jgi:hypothetical protein